MSKIRMIQTVIAMAAILCTMAVATGQALADSDHRCRQSGNQGREGTNTVNCFFDNGTRYANVETTISKVITKVEIDVIDKAVVNVLNNNSGCVGLINVLSCNQSVKDAVKVTLINLNLYIDAPITVNVGQCGCPKKY